MPSDETWGQPSLFEDLVRVRPADPETSHIAAARLSSAESHCWAMLKAYGAHPAGITDEEAAYSAGLCQPGICWWHRASDLRARILIEWLYEDGTGVQVKRMGSNGRPVGVSRITEHGRAQLARRGAL